MNGGKVTRPKIFSVDHKALWIEAALPAGDCVAPSDSISFQPGAIDHIRTVGAKNCLVTLKSGVEFSLNMSGTQLLERLQSPEEAVLDLKPYACHENKDALIQRLREEFRLAAEAEKYAAIEGLTFRAWVRPPGKADFRNFTFSGKDIKSREISEGDSIMGGKNMRFHMKRAEKAPFDGAEFIMEGKLEEFRALCEEAFAAGRTELSLLDYSLRKGTVPPEEKPQASPPRRPSP